MLWKGENWQSAMEFVGASLEAGFCEENLKTLTLGKLPQQWKVNIIEGE